jgi:pyruvate/2-oxoglutarate dehydrogenase complex dihydrolipoamide dehydrogenase (E3) component
MPYDLAVIGAGMGGVKAATEAARLGGSSSCLG